MKVTFRYFALVRKGAGTEREQVELPDGADARGALATLAQERGGDFQRQILDDSGTVRSNLIVLVNGQTVRQDEQRTLADGDEVSVFSPVAGG
ncbi:MAG: MoaD/ThiS family protein [Planctomycetes bacterium]|nr:MoaD/ThiS family protein [Planctomycetota bacterium]